MPAIRNAILRLACHPAGILQRLPLMNPVQGKLYCSDRRFDCWLVAG